jgi:phytanoyl-CoA hydroxylase
VHEAKTVHWADGNSSETRDRKAMGLVYFSDRAQEDKAAQAAYQQKLKADLEDAGKI